MEARLKLRPGSGLSSERRHTPCAQSGVSEEPSQREKLDMRIRLSTAALAAATFIGAGCGHGKSANDTVATRDSAAAATANGSVVPASDTTHGAISATTQAIGPGIQVTTTDEHNVNRAFDLKLTNDDWARFLKAADSVAALRARDPQVRAHLDSTIVGARTDDAGQKWLESDPKVSAAITSANLTVKDYYRLGIVTAEAVRFMSNPKAAPPTPAGRSNAEFVKNHQADLEHLQAISKGGTPSVR